MARRRDDKERDDGQERKMMKREREQGQGERETEDDEERERAWPGEERQTTKTKQGQVSFTTL